MVIISMSDFDVNPSSLLRSVTLSVLLWLLIVVVVKVKQNTFETKQNL